MNKTNVYNTHPELERKQISYFLFKDDQRNSEKRESTLT